MFLSSFNTYCDTYHNTHDTITSMKRTNPKIAFMGDLTVDRYVKQKEVHLGGSSLTSAIWATRLGAKSSIIAAVGTDNFQIPQYIDKSRVTVLPGKTSSIEIHTNELGEREYGNWDPGVLADYRFSKKDFACMRTHDAVVLTVYDKTIHLLYQFRDAFASRRKRKFLRVGDFGDLSLWNKDAAMLVRYLSTFDVFLFGLDKDIDEFLINELRQLAHQSRKLFLVTLNKFGAAAFAGDTMFGVPGHDVPVLDTTGAGDSFLAAFLVEYLKSHDVQKSLVAGTQLASQVIQNVGAY